MLQTRKKITVEQYSYKNKIYILCIIEHIPTYDTTMRATTDRQVHFTKQLTNVTATNAPITRGRVATAV